MTPGAAIRITFLSNVQPSTCPPRRHNRCHMADSEDNQHEREAGGKEGGREGGVVAVRTADHGSCGTPPTRTTPPPQPHPEPDGPGRRRRRGRRRWLVSVSGRYTRATRPRQAREPSWLTGDSFRQTAIKIRATVARVFRHFALLNQLSGPKC